MELKGILESFVGCLLAVLVGPVLMSCFSMILMWAQSRIHDMELDRDIRKVRAIGEAMRRNPGKTWTLHGPEWYYTHDDERGDSGTLV